MQVIFEDYLVDSCDATARLPASSGVKRVGDFAK